jgi:diaminopimelate epimerase
LRFGKYEGLGNDFIVVDGASAGEITRERAVALCDRRFGIGADGVLVVTPTDGTPRMKVLNADGSNPEMCGNGLRCVALHLAIEAGVDALDVVVSTDAGPRACKLTREGLSGSVSVDMGEVRSTGELSIEILGKKYDLFLGDAGNPHAIMFGRFTREDAARLGPLIEKDASFPKGTNVEFASVHDARIDLVVWERGVGITLACGTGACATAVVAREQGLIGPGAVKVALLGGELEIDPSPAGRTTMVGPARRVFVGEA